MSITRDVRRWVIVASNQRLRIETSGMSLDRAPRPVYKIHLEGAKELPTSCRMYLAC